MYSAPNITVLLYSTTLNTSILYNLSVRHNEMLELQSHFDKCVLSVRLLSAEFSCHDFASKKDEEFKSSESLIERFKYKNERRPYTR